MARLEIRSASFEDPAKRVIRRRIAESLGESPGSATGIPGIVEGIPGISSGRRIKRSHADRPSCQTFESSLSHSFLFRPLSYAKETYWHVSSLLFFVLFSPFPLPFHSVRPPSTPASFLLPLHVLSFFLSFFFAIGFDWNKTRMAERSVSLSLIRRLTAVSCFSTTKLGKNARGFFSTCPSKYSTRNGWKP